MNRDQLEGKVAIVTGAAGGYGKGIASVLRDCGVKVWITDIDEDTLNATISELGVKGMVADVATPADWDKLFDAVMADAGRLDILINNAGCGFSIAPLEEQSDDVIALSIAVNLTGKILGCKRAAKIMKAQGSGTIINVSSVCARQSWPGWSTYSAAKGGVVNLSKCLYTELRPHGVRVTTVIPSWGATKFTENAQLGLRDEETLKKCIKPTELGDLMAYICSLPPHLEMQDVTFLPMVQEIEPL